MGVALEKAKRQKKKKRKKQNFSPQGQVMEDDIIHTSSIKMIKFATVHENKTFQQNLDWMIYGSFCFMTVRGHSSQWHLLIRQIRVRDYKAVTAHVSSTFPSPSFFSQDYSWSLSLSLYLSHFLPCILNNSSLSQFKVFILFCSLLKFPFPEFQLGWIHSILSTFRWTPTSLDKFSLLTFFYFSWVIL